jgi:plasmid maintenance system antidote protein VapI
MAVRFEKAFGVDMETILRLQHAYDVAAARKGAGAIAVSRYKEPSGASAKRGRAA